MTIIIVLLSSNLHCIFAHSQAQPVKVYIECDSAHNRRVNRARCHTTSSRPTCVSLNTYNKLSQNRNNIISKMIYHHVAQHTKRHNARSDRYTPTVYINTKRQRKINKRIFYFAPYPWPNNTRTTNTQAIFRRKTHGTPMHFDVFG